MRHQKLLGDLTAAFDAWKWAIVQKDDKEEKFLSAYRRGSRYISGL